MPKATDPNNPDCEGAKIRVLVSDLEGPLCAAAARLKLLLPLVADERDSFDRNGAVVVLGDALADLNRAIAGWDSCWSALRSTVPDTPPAGCSSNGRDALQVRQAEFLRVLAETAARHQAASVVEG